MWGRVVEMATAVWLAVSPWVFEQHQHNAWFELLVALAIVILASLSYWPPTRHAHLGILLIAVGLMVWGRLDGTPPSPIHQNYIVVGLFLLMIAIIPNDASNPPVGYKTKAMQLNVDPEAQRESS
jgi:hypothetical protein